MANAQRTESKWEQRWHDGVIDDLEAMLRGFTREIEVECHRGKTPGADLVIRPRKDPARAINVEVQMHPSGKGILGTMDRWAARHAQALATFIVCPMALLPTMARRVDTHRTLGRSERLYLLGDTAEQLTLLCSCVYSLIQR